MGSYVNPEKESKESWLTRNGKIIPLAEARIHKDFTNIFLVVLVDNLAFSAAGIAYDQIEVNDFTDPLDRRPRTCFLVPKESLLLVSDLGHYLKKTSGGQKP